MMYAALWTEWVADSFVWNHRLEGGWTKNDLVGTTSTRFGQPNRIAWAADGCITTGSMGDFT
jgi:hypothetical protein